MRIAVFTLAIGACWGQSYDVMYAKITGGSGDRGKCTIEYTADGTADFEILAEQARMKTVSGQRAVWKRFECNRPLPPDPTDFRLSVQNGRSTLTTAPSKNRGVALIRATGSGKFDLEWTGGTSTSSATVSGTPAIVAPPATTSAALGDGYFRDFRGTEQALSDAGVKIDGNRVQVELVTSSGSRISFTGTVTLKERDRVAANVTGGTMQGSLEVLMSGTSLTELAMTGVGANRFEVRWQRR